MNLNNLKEKMTHSTDDYDILGIIGAYAFFNEDKTVYRYDTSGSGNYPKLLEKLTEMFGKAIFQHEDTSHGSYIYFKTDTSVVKFSANLGMESLFRIKIRRKRPETKRQPQATIELITSDEELLESFKTLVSKFLKKDADSSSSILALTSGQGGLQLTNLGTINSEFVSDNYSDEVVKQYEHAYMCLNSKNPCGRLILMQGSPGTGKSYMIRSLVSTINSTFIVVGSNMISELAGPHVLPTLLNQLEHTNRSIVFILEDADEALKIRKEGELNKLSSVLNLGDGLVGELLDIRIIATTNASKVQLDPAITRPGRLCSHMQLDILGAEQAMKIYSRLVKEPKFPVTKEISLADIYRLAREDGWVPKDAKKLIKTGQYI